MKIIHKPVEQRFPIARQCYGCKATLEISENDLKLVSDDCGFTVAFRCPVCGDENAADVTYEYKQKFIAKQSLFSQIKAMWKNGQGTTL